MSEMPAAIPTTYGRSATQAYAAPAHAVPAYATPAYATPTYEYPTTAAYAGLTMPTISESQATTIVEGNNPVMAWRDNVSLQLSSTSLASSAAAEYYIRPPILFPLVPPTLDHAVIAGVGGIRLAGIVQMAPQEVEHEEPPPPGVEI